MSYQKIIQQKNQLLWLIWIYEITRKLFLDFTIKQFWGFWRKTADDVLLPFLPEEACRNPWWVRYTYPHEGSKAQLKELREQIQHKRLNRWPALIKKAEYKEREYDQVIKYHFTRFWILAKAHRQRLTSWKHHKLMAKPRFFLEKQKS